MADNVVNVSELQRKHRQSSRVRYEIPDTPATRSGRYKGAILRDGSVVLEMPTEQGPVQYEMSPADARDLDRLLSSLAMHGERRQKALRGDHRWVPRAVDGGGYRVRHGGHERSVELCRIGQRRTQPRCDACRRELAPGEEAYREGPRRLPYPNWRDVRLCRGCVETPAKTGISEVTDA